MAKILFITIYFLFFFAVMFYTWKTTKKMPASNPQDTWLLLGGLAMMLILAGVALYYLVLIGSGYKIKP